jgi:hypothetical protein
MEPPNSDEKKNFSLLITTSPVTNQDEQIAALEKKLEESLDARREDRFVGIVLIVLLLDVVFFSVMPTFGGPLALLVLQLLILIPLARRMGMEEIATILSRVIARIADNAYKKDS